MTWYMVYEVSNGSPVSLGTVVADPLPTGMAAKALPNEPDQSIQTWNPVSLLFEDDPAKVKRKANAETLMLISLAEGRQTIRMMRAALLGDQTAKNLLAQIESEITELRGRLL